MSDIPRWKRPERKEYMYNYYRTVTKPQIEHQRAEATRTREKKLSNLLKEAHKEVVLTDGEELSFLASMLCGEGSCYIILDKKGLLKPILDIITNNDWELIKYCREILRTSPLYIRFIKYEIKNRGKYTKSHRIGIGKQRNIFECLIKLRPFIPSGTRMAKKVDLMLEYCASRLKWSDNKVTRRGYSPRELEIYKELKVLNRRGVRSSSPSRDRLALVKIEG